MEGFKTIGSGDKIADLAKYVTEYIGNDPNIKVYIGCDSKQVGKQTAFVTAVVLKHSVYPWNSKGDGHGNWPGQGGHIIFKKEYRDRIYDIRMRLWEEANIIMELAEYLNSALEEIRTPTEEHPRLLTIDFDYNSSAIHKSNAVANEVVGWAAGMGYEYRIKPDSWCASSVADNLL